MIVDIGLNAIGNFGNPFHGRWRDGVFTLPNSAVKTLTEQPAGGPTAVVEFGLTSATLVYDYWPSYGDCLLVAIDGLPQPTTTAAETAAGQTWLNYTLLSGARHIFYGKELSYSWFIYLDPNNQPWRCGIFKPNDSFVIDLRKMGSFDGANTLHQLNVPTSISGVGGVRAVVISDANSKGRVLCIDAFAIIQNGINISSRKPLRVELSGIPGVNFAAAFSALPLADTVGAGPVATKLISPFDSYVGDAGDGCLNMPQQAKFGYKSAAATTSSRYAAVAVIFDGDIEKTVRAETNWSFGTSITHELNVNPVIYQSAGTWKVSCGNLVATEAVSVVQNLDTYNETGTWTWTFASQSFSGPNGVRHPVPYLIRRSNKVWEWVLHGGNFADIGADTGQLFSLALIMPDRIERTNYLIPIASTKTGRHFSYHPKTKELLSDNVPVCWL